MTQDAKSIKIVVGAYSTTDYGDGPGYAAFMLNESLLEKLEKLVGICNEHSLSECRMTAFPEKWGPGTIETDLRLQNGEMVILPGGSFWFTDYPKNCDYHIMTRDLQAMSLREVFEESVDGQVVMMTDSTDAQEMYESDQSPEETGESGERQ